MNEIIRKLTLKAAEDPKSELSALIFKTISHIESLEKELAEIKEKKYDYWDIAK